MNQSILFNDDLIWCNDKKQASLTAQSAGLLVQVIVSKRYLQRLGLDSVEPTAVIKFCQDMQFDIEDDAQRLIEEERLNENNQLHLL